MRILVTGGCGFIGSHLVDRLVSEEHDVLVIDSLINGEIENLNNAARFVETDIRDQTLEKIFLDFKPEVVYHMAAQIDIQASLVNPLLDADINVLGTINLLNCCASSGVRKIIYSSSAAIYGNPSILPISESVPAGPISFYGLSKFTPESYIKIFSNMYDFKYTILRYSNVYGERQLTKGEGGVIPIFINNILNGIPPKIFGDGEQTRDFIYVKDVVSANVSVMNTGDNRVYNVSTNTPITINDLFIKLSALAHSSLTPLYCETRHGDIVHNYMDNSNIYEELHWQPSFSLLEGLTQTYDNFANLKIRV